MLSAQRTNALLYGEYGTNAGVCKRGWYISFGGIVTFKSSHELRDVVKAVPENRLLIETDAPYLAPEPVRGSKNEPKNVKIIAEVLARIRG